MRILSLAILVLCPLVAHGQDADFLSLFNGKDFSGWRFSEKSAFGETPKNWSVADGVIRLHGGGSPHIATQWPFDDFDIRFQWKAAKKGYNSGFYVRSGRKVGANQINLAEKAVGNLMGGAKGGNAVPELQNPPGEWNDWRVLAQGDKLTFWCNGKEAWTVTGFKPASGYIGFQAEGAAIDFKNLRVKELGYQTLDLAGKGWSSDGDIRAASKAAETVAFPGYPSYTLRLEFQGMGAIAIGGKEISLAGGEFEKRLNPAGQWNYLQIAVAKNQASIWINGEDVKTPVETTGGAIRILPLGDFKVRGLRIRDTK